MKYAESRTLQIAFYKGRFRFFNRAVAWWLRGPYSHCELILSSNGTSSVCASSSYMDGGVRIKRMVLDPDHWDIVTVTTDADPRAWLQAHQADRYDLLGLLGFVWRRQTGEQCKWFCSEAVAAMLGFPEPWRFDPMTLWSALAGRAQPSSTMEVPSNG